MIELAKADVFVDLGVQLQYLPPAGLRPCLNGELIYPNLKHLFAFARLAKTPVLSCVDVHRPNAIGEGFLPGSWRGSLIEQRPMFALLPSRTLVECDNCLCVPLDLLRRFQQALFPKHHRDPFTNPKLDRLLTEMPVRRFVLFGTSLEISLRILALGLLRRGRRVVVVEDACGYWNRDEARMAMRQLDVKGCTILTAQQYIQTSMARMKLVCRDRSTSSPRVA